MPQRVHEEIRAVAAVEAELHLVQIPRQVLGAEPVPRSHDAALEQREGRFHSVSVSIAIDVNLCRLLRYHYGS